MLMLGWHGAGTTCGYWPRPSKALISLDPVKVADYLHKDAKNLKTLFGPASISGEKTLGINAAVSTQQAIFVAKDGKPVFVKWVLGRDSVK